MHCILNLVKVWVMITLFLWSEKCEKLFRVCFKQEEISLTLIFSGVKIVRSPLTPHKVFGLKHMLMLKSIAHIHAIYACRVHQEFHASDLTFSHLNLINNNNDILLETHATFNRTHSRTLEYKREYLVHLWKHIIKILVERSGCLNMKKERL